MNSEDYTATLRGGNLYGKNYVGRIFGDKRGKFKDGTLVTTSPVVSIEGDTLTTKNSVYKLED